MRDGQVYEMNHRRAQNEAVLYKQIHFLASRMETFENVIRGSSLIDRIRWVSNPFRFIVAVDMAHLRLMKKHEQLAREDAEKAKEQAQKPKITIVGANGLEKR
jgi:hypothetical protein